MTEARIALVGAGANGGSIAADLIRSGRELTVIEQWPAHVEKMRADGLRVITPEEEIHVRPDVRHLCEVAELRENFDIVLVLVKAYDTPWVAQLLAPRLADDGLLVGVQNGMTTGMIADVVGSTRTMGCVIECSATMNDPGIIHRHTPVSRSWFAIGALPGGASGREEEVAALLRTAGTVELFDDIESAKWMKLVSNSTLLVTSAILGIPMLDALHTPGFREVMIEAGKESLRVGAALGHQVLPIFGLTDEDIADREALVDVMTDKLFTQFVVPGATTTVLQDWRKGRRSEADDLGGHVARHGRERGIPVPVNEQVTRLAHRIEAGELEPAPENMALLRAALS